MTKPSRFQTTEAFSATVLGSTALLVVLYFIFRQQYDGENVNQLSEDNAATIRLAFGGVVTATLIGYRDALKRMVSVGDQKKTPPTPIRSGALFLYVVGLSGIVLAIAFLVCLRFGLIKQDFGDLVTGISGWWGGTVGWTLTEYIQIQRNEAPAPAAATAPVPNVP